MRLLSNTCLLWFFGVSSVATAEPALKRSDVVFMYQADRQTYEDYGATVLAWGGKPTPQSKAEAQAAGVKFFGSVGMVTEFARYYERFPQTYEQGLCRDVEGQPVKVPWLTDHQHKGVPYWWCCTQQPQFRQYLRERVIETVTGRRRRGPCRRSSGHVRRIVAGHLFLRPVRGGVPHAPEIAAGGRTQALGVAQPDEFNYRDVLRQWQAAADSRRSGRSSSIRLWSQWSPVPGPRRGGLHAGTARVGRQHGADGRCRSAPTPACCGRGTWRDYQALDLFSAETDHHAAGRRFTDQPLVAYRLAEAVQRPYAATASGGDWAFIKEHQLPGLVRGWVALSYAAGQCLMAPHRQWCYTPEKGTHWYAGTGREIRAAVPVRPGQCAVVRRLRDLRRRGRGAAASFVPEQPPPLVRAVQPTGRGQRLVSAAAGRGRIGGPSVDGGGAERLPGIADPERGDSCPPTGSWSRAHGGPAGVRDGAEVLANVKPAVQTQADGVVRALPRVAAGSAVVHLLNYAYDAARDDVRPLKDVQVRLDLSALGVPDATACQFLAPDAEPQSLPVDQRHRDRAHARPVGPVDIFQPNGMARPDARRQTTRGSVVRRPNPTAAGTSVECRSPSARSTRTVVLLSSTPNRTPANSTPTPIHEQNSQLSDQLPD